LAGELQSEASRLRIYELVSEIPAENVMLENTQWRKFYNLLLVLKP